METLFVRRHGGFAQTLQAMNSNVAASAYAAGSPYTPLAKNATEQYVTFDLVAPQSGTLVLTAIYAPSVSNGGDMVFELDYKLTTAAGDPNAAITTQSSFTFTPGTGATLKSKTDATMRIAVVAGDHIFLKLTRKNSGSDTHTGSANVLGIRAEIV